MFGEVFEIAIDKMTTLLAKVINCLPDSPFETIDNSDVNSFLGGLNWIFPISQMISILSAWLVVVSVFYTYQLILRWTRIIR